MNLKYKNKIQVACINQNAVFSNTLLNNIACAKDLGKTVSPLLNLNNRASFLVTEQN